MNTRYYLLRTTANQVLPGSPAGVVDTGYADASHQLQFASLADLMSYATVNGELVYAVSDSTEAKNILFGYQQTGTAPAGVPPMTGLALTLSTLPWYVYVAGAWALSKLL